MEEVMLQCEWPAGPALVFEGEESMIAAISENPMSFKVNDVFYN